MGRRLWRKTVAAGEKPESLEKNRRLQTVEASRRAIILQFQSFTGEGA